MMPALSTGLFCIAAILVCLCQQKTEGATSMSPTTMTSSTTPSTTTMTSSTTPSTTTMTPSTTPSTTTMTSSTTPSTTTMTSTFPSTTFSSTTSTPTSTQKPGRPKFSKLKAVYPTYAKYPADAKKLRKDMTLPGWLFTKGRPNTCAIRLSKAFHDSGEGIDRSKVKKCATKPAKVNAKGRELIIRVLFFQCYLRAIWGQPDVTKIKTKADIKGQQGVIIFTGCKGFGQHIDLWDGKMCSMGCDYFKLCTSIELYKLP